MITNNLQASISYTWMFAQDNDKQIPENIMASLNETAENILAENISLSKNQELSMTEYLLVNDEDEDLTEFTGHLVVTFS